MSDNDKERLRYLVWLEEINDLTLIEGSPTAKYPAPFRDELRRRISNSKMNTIEWYKSVLNSGARVYQTPIVETVEGIHSKFTKHHPDKWLSAMNESKWMKAGLPGITSGDVLNIIKKKDDIDNEDFPPMYECTWSQLKEKNRHRLLIVMIKAFMEFNKIEGISEDSLFRH
jgi:hypothetical protein